MFISVFDLFKIGIGPSSSHTVGPMLAARGFVLRLRASGRLAAVAAVKVELFGALAATGKGHHTDLAVLMGLEGGHPEYVDPESIPQRVQEIRKSRRIRLLGEHEIPFDEAEQLKFLRRKTLEFHPNAMRCTACDANDGILETREYYSVGGGFIVEAETASADSVPVGTDYRIPCPFATGAELLALCAERKLSMAEVMLANERCFREEADIRAGLLRIWQVMRDCVERGCHKEGVLPGGLKVRRRAAGLFAQLNTPTAPGVPRRPTTPVEMDWVDMWAMAVNEENAAGGRVVTAPTNGAAGIIPAVMHYYEKFCAEGDMDDAAVNFLLTAAAIGILFKLNASISGAEVGCQGEVGVASAMAAGALVAVLGGNPEQVEQAAEIGMEHNLGLTCDPIGGLVQVPCIERNAMGAVKAINAAAMALRSDGKHYVSLDRVIRTMRDTGRDMMTKYKETARGGLAVNVTEC